VVVRGCPLGTGQDRCEWHASGKAAEDDPGIGCAGWFYPDPTVRLVFGHHRLVGKSPEDSRQPSRELPAVVRRFLSKCGPSTDRGEPSLGAALHVTKITPDRCQQA
jgi:hypothetical protein